MPLLRDEIDFQYWLCFESCCSIGLGPHWLAPLLKLFYHRILPVIQVTGCVSKFSSVFVIEFKEGVSVRGSLKAAFVVVSFLHLFSKANFLSNFFFA